MKECSVNSISHTIAIITIIVMTMLTWWVITLIVIFSLTLQAILLTTVLMLCRTWEVNLLKCIWGNIFEVNISEVQVVLQILSSLLGLQLLELLHSLLLNYSQFWGLEVEVLYHVPMWIECVMVRAAFTIESDEKATFILILPCAYNLHICDGRSWMVHGMCNSSSTAIIINIIIFVIFILSIAITIIAVVIHITLLLLIVLLLLLKLLLLVLLIYTLASLVLLLILIIMMILLLLLTKWNDILRDRV